MSTAEQINDIVVEALQPVRLDVVNESHMHNVPEGSESHFKLIIVSEAFSDKNLVARHRTVNKLLAQQLQTGVHALSMHTYTPTEWNERGGEAPVSPPCMGGKAKESAN